MKTSCVAMVLFAVGVSVSVLRAQSEDWQVFYSTNSPLPGDIITTMVMDSAGAVWIGTDAGLARVDRFGWTVFKLDSMFGPLYRKITGMVVDTTGRLWVCADQAIFVYTAGSWSKRWDTWAKSLTLDHDGNIWYVSTAGIVKYDFVRTTNFPQPGYTRDICIDKDNRIILATSGGVLIFDGSATIQLRNSISAWAVCRGLGDTVFVGTIDGLGVLTRNTYYPRVVTRTETGLTASWVESTTYDAAGRLWVGTNVGLAMLSAGQWTSFTVGNSRLPNGHILCLLHDRAGNMWIGTEQGLAVYRSGGPILSSTPPPVSNSDLAAAPNPFVDRTTLQVTTRHSRVLLIIDALGRVVRELQIDDGREFADWDGRNSAGEKAPGGVYFAQQQQAGTRPTLLLKLH